VFNVADIAVCVGVGLLVLHALKGRGREGGGGISAAPD
jgi:lipoprotein signal peptidase